MTAEAALRSSSDGLLLDVQVTPGASDAGFPTGFNPWRERLEARVSAPARDGAANEELVELVAAFLDVDARSVRIVQGATGRRKTLLVRSVGREAVLHRLREHLG